MVRREEYLTGTTAKSYRAATCRGCFVARGILRLKDIAVQRRRKEQEGCAHGADAGRRDRGQDGGGGRRSDRGRVGIDSRESSPRLWRPHVRRLAAADRARWLRFRFGRAEAATAFPVHGRLGPDPF